jgi:hypothetical protein
MPSTLAANDTPVFEFTHHLPQQFSDPNVGVPFRRRLTHLTSKKKKGECSSVAATVFL